MRDSYLVKKTAIYLVAMDHNVYNDESELYMKNSSVPILPLEAVERPIRTFLDTLYIITSLLALILNLIAFGIILRTKKTAKELKKYLANLTITDLVLGVFNVPFTYIDFMYGIWPFPSFVCPVWCVINVWVTFTNIYLLIAIGFGR